VVNIQGSIFWKWEGSKTHLKVETLHSPRFIFWGETHNLQGSKIGGGATHPPGFHILGGGGQHILQVSGLLTGGRREHNVHIYFLGGGNGLPFSRVSFQVEKETTMVFTFEWVHFLRGRERVAHSPQFLGLFVEG
jgi:hypothetical protein